MNNNEVKRSIEWSACDCDDSTRMEYSSFDSQAEAEEFARERELPFIVGETWIIFPDGNSQFDEDAEPLFVRLHDVPLWTTEELAKRHDTRLKCGTCSFTEIFRNDREAMAARDVHEFEHGGDELQRPKHPVFVQHRDGTRNGIWLTQTCQIAEGITIEYPRPEDYGTTAVDISQ